MAPKSNNKINKGKENKFCSSGNETAGKHNKTGDYMEDMTRQIIDIQYDKVFTV